MIHKQTLTPVHGGDLTEASARLGRSEDGWLDLSTGINPCAYPDIAVSSTSLARLPSSGAIEGLLAAARKAYGIPPDAGLCAAPGTQANQSSHSATTFCSYLPSFLTGSP